MPTYFLDFKHSSFDHRDDLGTDLEDETELHAHMRDALVEVFRASAAIQGDSLTLHVRDATGLVATGRIEVRIEPEPLRTAPTG